MSAGKIIGKGGETVKKLKSDHEVWIKIMSKDEAVPGLEERVVTVSGELDNIMKAMKDVRLVF